MAVFSSLTMRKTAECQRVLQSKGAKVSGWRCPPSVAESREGVHLDGVLEDSPQPAVGQTHSHLQDHLQLEKDSVSFAENSGFGPCSEDFVRLTHLVWVAQNDHLCHFSRASGWKIVPAGGPHV